jgi:hypothetical protein
MNPMKKNSFQSKNRFSKEDDEQIRNYVKEFGTDFSRIGNYLDNRTPKQVKERWRLYLDPDVDRKPFSIEEDLLLKQKYQECHKKWCQIAKLFLIEEVQD